MNAQRTERQWCILRMAARTTLAVTQSLTLAGYEVWTPTAILMQMRNGAVVEVPAPILPTYAFADLCHLLDLLAMSESRPQEDFWVMRRPGGFAMCCDRELAGFRQEEAARQPKPEKVKRRRRIAERYDVGAEVRVPTGSGFAGLDGTVEASDGRYTDLYFGGFLRLKIETFILRGDGVSEADQLAA